MPDDLRSLYLRASHARNGRGERVDAQRSLRQCVELRQVRPSDLLRDTELRRLIGHHGHDIAMPEPVRDEPAIAGLVEDAIALGEFAFKAGGGEQF